METKHTSTKFRKFTGREINKLMRLIKIASLNYYNLLLYTKVQETKKYEGQSTEIINDVKSSDELFTSIWHQVTHA